MTSSQHPGGEPDHADRVLYPPDDNPAGWLAAHRAAVEAGTLDPDEPTRWSHYVHTQVAEAQAEIDALLATLGSSPEPLQPLADPDWRDQGGAWVTAEAIERGLVAEPLLPQPDGHDDLFERLLALTKDGTTLANLSQSAVFLHAFLAGTADRPLVARFLLEADYGTDETREFLRSIADGPASSSPVAESEEGRDEDPMLSMPEGVYRWRNRFLLTSTFDLPDGWEYDTRFDPPSASIVRRCPREVVQSGGAPL